MIHRRYLLFHQKIGFRSNKLLIKNNYEKEEYQVIRLRYYKGKYVGSSKKFKRLNTPLFHVTVSYTIGVRVVQNKSRSGQ